MPLAIELLELKLDESGLEKACIGCRSPSAIYKEGGARRKRLDLASLARKRGGIRGGGWKRVT